MNSLEKKLVEVDFFCQLHTYSPEVRTIAAQLLKEGRQVVCSPASGPGLYPIIWVAPREGDSPELGLSPCSIKLLKEKKLIRVKGKTDIAAVVKLVNAKLTGEQSPSTPLKIRKEVKEISALERALVELAFFCKLYQYAPEVQKLAECLIQGGETLHYFVHRDTVLIPNIVAYLRRDRVAGLAMKRHSATLGVGFASIRFQVKNLEVSLKLIEEFRQLFEKPSYSVQTREEATVVQQAVKTYLKMLRKGQTGQSLASVLTAAKLSR